jgi:pimeloyl-ACP methyl ester carboxylesterase
MAPVVLMLTLLLQAGPVAAQDATPIAASPVPTSGDFDGLVDIGNGRRLYLTCRGSGSPTVLLEAGAGNNAQIWEQIALPADSDKEAVLPAVAQFTRVCAYDRPGTLLDEVNLSRSDPVTGRRTAEEMVADVHALIEAAGLELPLVLAGHSFGGLIDRLYTNTYPSDVAGLVFIDAAHEDYYEGLHELLTPEQWTAAQDLPLPVTESIDSLASGAQVHAAQETSPLPSIPAVVLAHGSKGFGFGEDYPGEALEQIWRSAQEKLAALVPGSKFIVATESGHYIQLDQPELVIDAIRDVVEAVRDPGSWATPVASPSAG